MEWLPPGSGDAEEPQARRQLARCVVRRPDRLASTRLRGHRAAPITGEGQNLPVNLRKRAFESLAMQAVGRDDRPGTTAPASGIGGLARQRFRQAELEHPVIPSMVGTDDEPGADRSPRRREARIDDHVPSLEAAPGVSSRIRRCRSGPTVTRCPRADRQTGCKPSGFERDVVIDDRCRRRQHGRKRKQSRQSHPSKTEMMCL